MATFTTPDDSPRQILQGKKALVCGIANDSSIAYGCASAFHEVGADLAITYATEKAKAYVEPLAKALDASIFMPLDVAKPGDLEAVFERIKKDWGRLDVLVHSIAWAPKEDLQGGSSTARPRASARRSTSRATRSFAWRGSLRL